ncbi:MAG TPA: GNAT family N-acetyltransferase, partial [Armatimonadetes bacterium]|nr:GNAT family N-acetyltransferase [Armatimonadota bacterium]
MSAGSAAASLRVEVISHPARFSALRREWNALLRESRVDTIFLTWEWLWTWWQVFSPGRELRIIALWDGKHLVGLAPFLKRPVSYLPGLVFDRLEFLASGEEEADEICSDYLNFIAHRDYEQLVVRTLAHCLTTTLYQEWDEIVLSALEGNNPYGEWLPDLFPPPRYLVTRRPLSTSFRLSLPASWEEYLQSLSRNTRAQVRRSLRALEEAGEWRLHRPTTREELSAAEETLRTLHQSRWTKRGKPGVFASERFCTFHYRMMRYLFAQGQLDLVTLIVKGEPIGCLYNLRYGDTVFFYQSGIREVADKHLRPGVLLHVLAIREALGQGFSTYDFLRGEMRYKRSLGGRPCPLVELRIVCQRWQETLRQAIQKVKRRLRTRNSPVPRREQ